MRQIDSEEVKQVVFAILVEYARFCKDNNLCFYLSGGTLLGAIRHKGFIPWDDDIDVCMPRPDFDRFVKLAPNYFKTIGLVVKNGDSRTDFYKYPYCKLLNYKTRVYSQYRADELHLAIDIFAVDGLPENENELSDVFTKVRFWKRLLVLASARLGEGKTLFKKCFKFIPQAMVLLYGRKRCLRQIERIAERYPYEKCTYVGALMGGEYGVGERMLKAEFEKQVNVIFEGVTFPTFSCWDTYLRNLYGDYMKLPPEESRKIHYQATYIDE